MNQAILDQAIVAFVLAIGASSVQAQYLNAPNARRCTGKFDDVASFRVIEGVSYRAEVSSAKVTEHSGDGSGRGGGYRRPKPPTLRYSRIDRATVREADGRVLGVLTSTLAATADDRLLDRLSGSFVSGTGKIEVEVVGTCWVGHRDQNHDPELALGSATFTLSITGPAPAPRRPSDD